MILLDWILFGIKSSKSVIIKIICISLQIHKRIPILAYINLFSQLTVAFIEI